MCSLRVFDEIEGKSEFHLNIKKNLLLGNYQVSINQYRFPLQLNPEF